MSKARVDTTVARPVCDGVVRTIHAAVSRNATLLPHAVLCALHSAATSVSTAPLMTSPSAVPQALLGRFAVAVGSQDAWTDRMYWEVVTSGLCIYHTTDNPTLLRVSKLESLTDC